MMKTKKKMSVVLINHEIEMCIFMLLGVEMNGVVGQWSDLVTGFF